MLDNIFIMDLFHLQSTGLMIFLCIQTITSAVGVQEINSIDGMKAIIGKTKNVAILIYKAGCSGCSTGISLFEAGCAEHTDVTCIKTSNMEEVIPSEKDRAKFADWPGAFLFPKGKGNYVKYYVIQNKISMDDAMSFLINGH